MRQLLPAVTPLTVAAIAFLAALGRSYWLARMGLRQDLQDFIVTALWIVGGIVLFIAAAMISKARS